MDSSFSPSTDLTIRSESVQKLYTDYIGGRYGVNRRYQRKLVWTVEEKRALIDSILSDLPIPLVLVAEIGEHNSATYELIDGMQRLNAVFAFIENEFDLDGAYFDLESLADTKDRRDANLLTQKTPVLSREASRKVANYILPVSVFRAPTTEQVDKVFRRINSGGRRLSGQELRQAGSTASVAQLVRRFSSRIRGDSSSSDIVPLHEMPNLSINNRHLPYGIDVDSIFWVQQAVLRRLDVRSSFDEQLILDILVDCLIDPFLSSGTDTRDAAYDAVDYSEGNARELGKRLNDRVQVYTEEGIENDFFMVFDELRLVLQETGEKFVRHIVGRSSGGRYPRYFQAVFLAFWELIIKEGMRVADRASAASLLRGIGTERGALSIPGGGGDWTPENKRKNINAAKGAVRDAFEKAADRGEDASKYGLASYLEKILANSVTEQSLCELKQGLLSLDDVSRNFDSTSWKKIVRSIVAIANSGPENTGYLIIGVADNQATASRIKALDDVNSTQYRGYEVVGIEREAKVLGKSVKSYFDWFSDKLNGADIDSALRSQVASSMRLVDYHGRNVIILKINCADGPFFFEGNIFERKGSGTELVPQEEMKRIFRRFP